VNLFDQSQPGQRGEGVSEPSFHLGEEAGKICSGEAATSAGNTSQE